MDKAKPRMSIWDSWWCGKKNWCHIDSRSWHRDVTHASIIYPSWCLRSWVLKPPPAHSAAWTGHPSITALTVFPNRNHVSSLQRAGCSTGRWRISIPLKNLHCMFIWESPWGKCPSNPTTAASILATMLIWGNHLLGYSLLLPHTVSDVQRK